MSMKVYDSYKSSVTDLQELFSWLQSMREPSLKIAQGAVNRHIASEVCEFLDAQAFGIERKRPDLFTFLNEFKEAKSTLANGIRDLDYDHAVSAFVYPYQGSTYVRFQGENLASHPHLTEADHLVDYFYQNSSDKPKDVSQEEWDERYQIWSEIYDNGRPGFMEFEVVSIDECRPDFFEMVTMHEAQPSVEERALIIAMDMKMTGAGNLEISEVIKRHSQYKKWLTTDEGVQFLKEVRERLAEKYSFEEFKSVLAR